MQCFGNWILMHCTPVPRLARLVLVTSTSLLLACSSGEPPGQIPRGFVELADFAPGIAQDVRYFSDDNFVGERISGYLSPTIYLTREAGSALRGVQAELSAFGLGLKVFDAYRPQRAVDHFVRWARDLDDQHMKARYYPNVAKSDLFSDGYIAARSGHSRGSTVDLTLVDLDTGQELDMGTPWDFFDLASWPDSDQVTTQQQANRLLLRRMMLAAGFQPLTTEWWHFSLVDEPFPDTYFDFAVQ
ncbi:MAG: M15 family metallopeptidase [Pseudohongiellaceae bacterium]|jgi:D-alanyl-D-alanine dipeptidase